MKYTKLSGTGITVSRLCLGTMTFGQKISEEEACRAVSYAWEQGINFFDTADIYPPGSGGTSEEILGKAIRPFRNRAVIATKAGGPMGKDANDSGLGRKHLIQAVEDSLRRLNREYIDLYYLHFPDESVQTEEIMDTMEIMIRQGKILHYGVSNFPAWKVCEMKCRAERYAPTVYEGVYNLINRGVEDELLPFLKKYKMSMTVYNPLAGGLLTGKYRNPEPDMPGRLLEDKGYRERYFSDIDREAAGKLEVLAGNLGIALTELAYRWLLDREMVSSIIVGFSNLKQLQDNISLLHEEKQISYPEKEMEEIWKGIRGDWYSYFK